MKLKVLSLAAVALLSGCAGRYTGGGSLLDGPGGSLVGSFNLNNISAADCLAGASLGQDGEADTVRGAYKWNGADGNSFTCNVTEGYSIAGVGQFAGTISRPNAAFKANYPTATRCAIEVLPALGTWTAFVCAGTSSDCVLGEGDPPPLGPYTRAGLLDNGNVQYHKENTNGVCSSVKLP